jgi:2-phospho-L-lactate guanylyltransferase
VSLASGELWAVLPAKGFGRAKSRLGSVLSDPIRAAFARGLFEHVLATLQETPGLGGVLVLTDDEDVEALSQRHGSPALRDMPGTTGLAAIIDRGLAHVGAAGAGAALVCMADLPQLASADLLEVIEALRRHPVVIAPDTRGQGTNLLALCPPTRFATRFGRGDSFQQHLSEAQAQGAAVHVLRCQGLCFDVDGPEDLQALEQGG